LALSAGVTIFARHEGDACTAFQTSCSRTVTAQAQLLYAWQHWQNGILRALGATLRLDGTFGQDTLLTAGLGPTFRLYLMPDVIAVDATALAELGALRPEATPADGNPTWEQTFDVGAQISLLLSVRDAELFLDFPRISFLGEEQASRIALGMRFGWLF
jgi:hypothetical protein